MNLTEIKKRYPAEKPVCFNYMQAREDVCSLCQAVERQAKQIEEIETKLRMALPSERSIS